MLLAPSGQGAQAATVSQAQRASPPRAVAVESLWLTVANLNRSLSFYRDVLGMPVRSAATSANALLQGLTAPGARVRGVTLSAGSGPSLQLLEFSGVRHRSLHPHSVDPGAAILELSVPDISRVLSAAARAHTPIVSESRVPVTLPDGRRGIVLQDPDGFFVALFQPPQPAGTSAVGTALPSMHVLLTVAAPATMERFYRQVFGITLQASPFGSLGSWAQLLNQRTAQWAITQARPSAPAAAPELREVQFVSFRRVARHTYSGRPQDCGTATLSLRVTDVSAALRAIRSAGLRVLSAGGQPVPLRDGGTGILFRDPAGLLVDLVQR